MVPGGTTNRMSPVRAMMTVTVVVALVIIVGIVALLRSFDPRTTNTSTNLSSSATNAARSATPVPKESSETTNRSGTLTARADGTLVLRTPMYDEGLGAYAFRDITVNVTDATLFTEDDRRAAAIPVPGQKTVQRTPHFIEQNALNVGDTIQVFTDDPVLDKTKLDAFEVRRLLLPTAKR